MVAEYLTRVVRRIAAGRNQDFSFRRKEDLVIPVLDQIDLYLHIPFCHSLCPYCPYNRIRYDRDLVGPYTEAVLKEIEQYYSRLGRIEVSSIYIGGGTPTTIVDELGIIIEALRRKFSLRDDIGVETSPGDLTADAAGKLKSFGVDMISLGVQSFNQKYLNILGRNYNAAAARSAIDLAISAGFKTINVDLMFALPGQNLADILDDLEEAVNANVDQVTVYPLFTFPYSSIGRYRRLEKVGMPDFFKRRRMYRAIYDFCIQKGYHQVSVWGFKKGCSPKYSSVVRDNYIGLGAGAGSRLPKVFYFNTFSVKDYIETSLSGKLPVAIGMDLTPALQKFYWLYWRFYETKINRQDLSKVYGDDSPTRLLFRLLGLLRLIRQNKSQVELTERGSFYIHLLQNYFILDYINKVWTVSMREPWPEKIKI